MMLKLKSYTIFVILLAQTIIINTTEIVSSKVSDSTTNSTLRKIQSNLNESEEIKIPGPEPRKIKSLSKDSYLDALDHSKSGQERSQEGAVQVDLKTKASKVNRRTYESPVFRPEAEYGPPKLSYGPPNSVAGPVEKSRITYGEPPTQEPFVPTPSNSYSLPVQQSGSFGPQTPYGSGHNSYGPPPPPMPHIKYGPPSPYYGPTSVPQKIYGPPSNGYLAPTHGQGYGGSPWSGYALPDLPALPSFDFAWPLALKLNIFTIAKIILKLVIFKMIVKFIAIICLLLFIPKLEFKKDDNSMEESRELKKSDYTLERLNMLTSMVLDSIESYQRANGVIDDMKECTSISCRIKRFLGSGETKREFIGLFNSYAAEENELQDIKDVSSKNHT